jgi:hypothetical protein
MTAVDRVTTQELSPELTRIGRGGCGDELPLAIEGDDRAVEPDVNLDSLAGIVRGSGPSGELEDLSARTPNGSAISGRPKAGPCASPC